MSTPVRVRLAFAALALPWVLALASSLACSRPGGTTVAADWTGLDAELDRAPLPIGVLVDATGPGSAAGRPFADALRAALAAQKPVNGRPLVTYVFDDRSRPTGPSTAAERFERDPGAVIAIVGPEAARGAALAVAAPKTVVVCAGCEAAGAPREGSFALIASAGESSTATAEAVARWIVDALRESDPYRPCDVATALRTTPAPAGYVRVEGIGPAVDPHAFRLASAPAAKK